MVPESEEVSQSMPTRKSGAKTTRSTPRPSKETDRKDAPVKTTTKQTPDQTSNPTRVSR